MQLAHHELASLSMIFVLKLSLGYQLFIRLSLNIPGHWGQSPLGQRQPFQNPHSIALGLEAALQCISYTNDILATDQRFHDPDVVLHNISNMSHSTRSFTEICAHLLVRVTDQCFHDPDILLNIKRNTSCNTCLLHRVLNVVPTIYNRALCYRLIARRPRRIIFHYIIYIYTISIYITS